MSLPLGATSGPGHTRPGPGRVSEGAAQLPTAPAKALQRAWAWLGSEAEPGPGTRPRPLSAWYSRARAHTTAVDALLAVVVLGLSSANALVRGGPATTAVAWALQVALSLPLVWRRREPLGVFALICAVAFAQWSYGQRFLADAAILVALYTVTSRAPRRLAVLAAATVELGVVLAAEQRILGLDWARGVVVLTGMVAAAFFLGASVRARRAYTAALVERAQRLELQRDQQATIAVAAERASIAREMHDIVAHSLAVIITMADAAVAKRRSDPEKAALTMGQVSEIGRQALGETRRLLEVLRTDGAAPGHNPQPGLAQLDELVAKVRATGLAAELSVSGQPFELPEGAQLTVYRIVQEALTNTMKHAEGASRVRACLHYARPLVEVEVYDDGRPPAVGHPPPPGHGLVGMRERAALYQGRLTAGPRPGRGWAVQAVLDLGSAGAGTR